MKYSDLNIFNNLKIPFWTYLYDLYFQVYSTLVFNPLFVARKKKKAKHFCPKLVLLSDLPVLGLILEKSLVVAPCSKPIISPFQNWILSKDWHKHSVIHKRWGGAFCWRNSILILSYLWDLRVGTGIRDATYLGNHSGATCRFLVLTGRF